MHQHRNTGTEKYSAAPDKYLNVQLSISKRYYIQEQMSMYSRVLTSHSTQYRSFRRRGPWAVIKIKKHKSSHALTTNSGA